MFIWLKSYHYHVYELTIAIPNGGFRSKSEAARFQRTGVKPGFPDIGIFYPCGTFHGLFIEMKRCLGDGTGKPVISKEQERWIYKLREQGYVAYVCYGAEEAINAITKYLRL